MSLSPSPVPSGWYPDPSGERQWRVWTGREWSELTRPYGEAAPAPSIVADLPLIQALHRLVRYGIVGDFAGMSIFVSVLAHWPGTAHPVSEWFAVAACNVAVALVLVGSACFAFAGSRARRSLDALGVRPWRQPLRRERHRHEASGGKTAPARRRRSRVDGALRRAVPRRGVVVRGTGDRGRRRVAVDHDVDRPPLDLILAVLAGHFVAGA